MEIESNFITNVVEYRPKADDTTDKNFLRWLLIHGQPDYTVNSTDPTIIVSEGEEATTQGANNCFTITTLGEIDGKKVGTLSHRSPSLVDIEGGSIDEIEQKYGNKDNVQEIFVSGGNGVPAERKMEIEAKIKQKYPNAQIIKDYCEPDSKSRPKQCVAVSIRPGNSEAAISYVKYTVPDYR